MAEKISRDRFANLEDKEFIFHSEDGSELKLELIEVSEFKSFTKHEEYSLVFLAPPDSVLEPFTYTLQHEELGEIYLFLSPFWSDENGLKLEAAFSNLI